MHFQLRNVSGAAWHSDTRDLGEPALLHPASRADRAAVASAASCADWSMNSVMSVTKPFLAEKVIGQAVLLLAITDAPRAQVLVGRVEKLYSMGGVFSASPVGTDIEFVRSPGHWGDVPLEPKQRAIVFLTKASGRLYEVPWRGHLLLEQIEGVEHAIVQVPELWLIKEVPPALRELARPDPKRGYASAVRFDVMQAYLEELIAHADEGSVAAAAAIKRAIQLPTGGRVP